MFCGMFELLADSGLLTPFVKEHVSSIWDASWVPQLISVRCAFSFSDMGLYLLSLNLIITKVKYMAAMFFRGTNLVLSVKRSSTKEFLHLDMAIPAKSPGSMSSYQKILERMWHLSQHGR